MFGSGRSAGTQPALISSVKITIGLPWSTTVVATLTPPSSLVAGNNTFTAPPGTTLSANTDYYLVIEGSGPRRALRLGLRFDLGQRLSLSFEGERMETGYERADHSLMLRTSLPW